MQSPRILFGPAHIRNWLVDPDDFDAQADTVERVDSWVGQKRDNMDHFRTLGLYGLRFVFVLSRPISV